MKKIALAFLFLLALAGCGGGDPGDVQRQIDACAASGKYPVLSGAYRVYCSPVPMCPASR